MGFIKLNTASPSSLETTIHFNIQHIVAIIAPADGRTSIVTTEGEGLTLVKESESEVLALIEKASKK